MWGAAQDRTNNKKRSSSQSSRFKKAATTVIAATELGHFSDGRVVQEARAGEGAIDMMASSLDDFTVGIVPLQSGRFQHKGGVFEKESLSQFLNSTEFSSETLLAASSGDGIIPGSFSSSGIPGPIDGTPGPSEAGVPSHLPLLPSSALGSLASLHRLDSSKETVRLNGARTRRSGSDAADGPLCEPASISRISFVSESRHQQPYGDYSASVVHMNGSLGSLDDSHHAPGTATIPLVAPASTKLHTGFKHFWRIRRTIHFRVYV